MPSSASSAVADAGPLIAFGRLDLLWLLPELFSEVRIPRAVLAECSAQPDLPDAKRIASACASGLLLPCDSTPIDANHLGLGERHAIGKAKEIGGVLLADDLAARRHAHSLGLRIVGTLGVLVRAKRRGLITTVGAPIEALRESGYWIGESARSNALAAVGEHPP